MSLGRATTAYVSGYQRAAVHVSRLVRGESGQLTANFNGAMAPERVITSAVWRCDQPYAINMSAAEIDGRSVSVRTTAQFGSPSLLKCQVTLDNGDVVNQLFRIEVESAPWFRQEVVPAAGPYELTVLA